MTAKKWKTEYVKDLEYIFQEAFKNKNFSTALKAKELLAKELAKEGEVIGNKLVTVGMSVTRHPPYRSVRALLTHTAPTSSIWRENELLDIHEPLLA